MYHLKKEKQDTPHSEARNGSLCNNFLICFSLHNINGDDTYKHTDTLTLMTEYYDQLIKAVSND